MIKNNIDPRIKQRQIADLLTDPPVVVLVNKFDEASAKEFAECMIKAQASCQDVIPILIDSYGGHVYSLLSMIDIIQASPKPVATIVTGKAMSCGAVLFTCGSEGIRYIGPSATVMIHDVSSFAFGKVEDIKVDAKETNRLNKKIFSLMEKNIGKEKGYLLDIVKKRGHTDWYLDAKEAKHHNIANNIGIPELKISVNLSTSFGLI